MANVLPKAKRLQILAALVDGNSEHAVHRMTGAGRPTVSRFALRMGEGSARLHNRLARGLACEELLFDEIWSFCAVKQAHLKPHHGPEAGDEYTFVALDKASRLVVSYLVGKRDQETTDAFVADVRARVAIVPRITSDGFAPYISAIRSCFGTNVDYAQTVKSPHRARGPFFVRRRIYGEPDLSTVSTSYVERQNGTMRLRVGRLRRRCVAHSKKLANHRAAVALGYAWYNLGMVLATLKMTPAMAAGLTDHPWTHEEFMVVALAERETARQVAVPLPERVWVARPPAPVPEVAPAPKKCGRAVGPLELLLGQLPLLGGAA
jgi:IS1 family transposase